MSINSERQEELRRRQLEAVKRHRQKQQDAALQGKQRAFFLLPNDVVDRIKTLAGFHEMEQEQVVEKAVAMLWEDRYALHPMPINLRTPKIADDPLPEPLAEQVPEKVAPGEITSAIELEKTAAELTALKKRSPTSKNKRNTPPVLIDIIPDENDMVKTTN